MVEKTRFIQKISDRGPRIRGLEVEVVSCSARRPRFSSSTFQLFLLNKPLMRLIEKVPLGKIWIVNFCLGHFHEKTHFRFTNCLRPNSFGRPLGCIAAKNKWLVQISNYAAKLIFAIRIASDSHEHPLKHSLG